MTKFAGYVVEGYGRRGMKFSKTRGISSLNLNFRSTLLVSIAHTMNFFIVSNFSSLSIPDKNQKAAKSAFNENL